ncbi:phosphotyrosine protein phosphatase [Alkalilimnicola ehrlichii]|uniref:Phosphotyrosine protein phosphatase n=2 Tax=Alkalilimnicola ehrlichii TaxID=351052 RepID=A0A3E0WNJ9_9GAMM|nr:phosphotyrosine protein phosphatase [Alkalilimnicola ehrlichii]RFA33783.1 phosphotyrosine protein phosphatase [Alkalilimnicola ehrlichii]
MGNICRSPTAEGVFRHKVKQRGLGDRFVWDSAGTHSYHIGKAPDRRAQIAARRRGIEIGDLRARQVSVKDFENFHWVLAMDMANYEALQAIQPSGSRGRLHLFLEFARNFTDREVPDPYYGGDSGFEYVLDLVEDAADGLLQAISKPA